ncbi:YbfB/YjiJ family MFS transporter [Undibacterium sp. FT147W]|uniref:YbfB/YjiJ family MFS transporter n=1 Tax=Undibacterium rivi TaxID=2828729 RepID=A0ABS5GY00_9BURK|nr:YbfB/YjiJ family MFS transporter [Undibacterium rivi]MBR7791320.1 YbfB/YjiJ family MFS transporter [Undibacterium rivi]
MNTPALHPATRPQHLAILIALAAMLSLALAMGIGRFAFTPLFPLMLRDGMLRSDAGAWLAASNYLGYLIGALCASRVRLQPARLLMLSLICIVIVTAAIGLTSSEWIWLILRFLAGLCSAWALIATSAWGLGWMANLARPRLAGLIYAGVGLGIVAAGIFCLWAAEKMPARMMWIVLAFLAALLALLPLIVSFYFPLPLAANNVAAPVSVTQVPASTSASGVTALIICYGMFGFGYILPATYLPAQARQLLDDPQIFGWAWPVFGMAAAASTLIVAGVLGKCNRLHVWATSHALMAVGVILPCLWLSMTSIVLAALLVGGNFMVITMLGMQEARARATANPTAVLARMTASFAFGQLLGPVVVALMDTFAADHASALRYALQLATACLVVSAIYLWRKAESA